MKITIPSLSYLTVTVYKNTTSFKMFPELVYYTSESNLTSIYTAFPSKFPGDTLSPMFAKILEAFLETIFWYLCQCSHCFCVYFIGVCESSFFENIF
jgi:hypothetical protein